LLQLSQGVQSIVVATDQPIRLKLVFEIRSFGRDVLGNRVLGYTQHILPLPDFANGYLVQSLDFSELLHKRAGRPGSFLFFPAHGNLEVFNLRLEVNRSLLGVLEKLVLAVKLIFHLAYAMFQIMYGLVGFVVATALQHRLIVEAFEPKPLARVLREQEPADVDFETVSEIVQPIHRHVSEVAVEDEQLALELRRWLPFE